MMGCGGNKINKNLGTNGNIEDRFEISKCAKCKKKPFYINGQFI